jgi:hypothetical protein
MRIRTPLFSMVLIAASLIDGAHAADYKVEELSEAPAGLSTEMAAAINDKGYRLSGAEGVVCDVWLAKEIPLKPKFKPGLRIKYPLQAGQLMGAIRFPAASKPHDFRGQDLAPGVYTLRYGLQPEDGSHLGTSDIRDFLVGCPPKEDTTPKRIEDIKQLFQLSAKSAGTTHPAIFLLLPVSSKPFDAAAVRHDADKEFLILDGNLSARDGDKTVSLPISIVVVGKSEG